MNTVEASACLAQMRAIVEEDWARRRGRRGRTAAATEGTSHASLVVMETLDAYLAASRVGWTIYDALYPESEGFVADVRISPTEGELTSPTCPPTPHK